MLRLRSKIVISCRWELLYFLLLIASVYLISACSYPFGGSIDANDWVEIPAGEFNMGALEGDDDEEPVHRVSLPTYWISRHEVTNKAYQRCVKTGACVRNNGEGEYRRDHPVVNVTWGEARDYCSWIGGRLPTEAEWERAARGGLEAARYPWGDEQVSCEVGGVNGAQFGYCQGTTLPVGTFAPNDFGLYDMAGNAWEWVADWYDRDYYEESPESDPTGPDDGRFKVIRGGGWNYSVYGLRTAYRSVSFPESHANFIGFRCVLDSPPR